MSHKRMTLAAGILAGLFLGTSAGFADQPRPWQLTFQPAVTPVMERIEDFHNLLLVIITLISLFVLGLLVWIVIRYNQRANPTPSTVTHNTLLEVMWTIVPVLILVVIAIP